jgi:hypothetical protein
MPSLVSYPQMMTKTPELKFFGLDCWGWYLFIEGTDADDARARAIAEMPSDLYREMAEIANIKELTPDEWAKAQA